MTEEHIERMLEMVLASLTELRAELKTVREAGATRTEIAALSERLLRLEQTFSDLLPAAVSPAAPVPIPENIPTATAEPGPPEGEGTDAEDNDLPPLAAEFSPGPSAPDPAPAPPTEPTPEPEPPPLAALPEPEEPEPEDPEPEPTAPPESPTLAETEPPPPPAPAPTTSPFVPPPPHIPPPPAVPPASYSAPAALTPPPRPAYVPPLPPPREPMNWGDVETWLVPWITRAGVLIAVIGLGYLLSLGFKRLDVLGKVIVVYLACGAMFGTGVFFERKERYATWGKIMIAGGWAGFYITTFLIHYLEEARIIHDAALAAYLLMAVAAGMIAHSLKYRTQSLTTLTYFIAFLTIALSLRLSAEQTYFSLLATAVLAVSMLFILHFLQWRWLALFSLIACYGMHSIWLTPLASMFHAADGHTFQFWSGLAILILYWVTFTVAVFLDRPRTDREQSPGLALTALNFALFTALFRWHVGVQHPELRWIFTGVMALAYLILSYLAHSMRRKELYTLLLIIAVLCATMTLYFRLPGSWVAIAWLLQAEALYMAGRLTPERRFRWLGFANFAVVITWMLTHDLIPRDQVSIFGYLFYQRTLIFAGAAIIFYLNAASKYFLAQRSKNDEPFAAVFSYTASILWFLLMFRNWFPNKFLHVAVVSAVLALALMEIGIRLRDAHFRGQGLFYAFLAVLTALVPLVGADHYYYAKPFYYRIGCEAAVIVFAYIVFYRFRKLVAASGSPARIETAAAAFTAMAAVISALLFYRELEPRFPFWLSLSWMVLGVVLLEIGVALKNPFFRAQGYLLGGLTLMWSIHALTQRHGWFNDPVQNLIITGVVVAGFFYLFIRAVLSARTDSTYLSAPEQMEPWSHAGPIVSLFFSAAGTLLLALLLRKALHDVNEFLIAVAWLVSAVALLEAGVWIKSRTLHHQAMVLAGAAFIYAMFHNALETGPMIGPVGSRLLTLILSAALLYYLHARVQLARQSDKEWADLPGAAPMFSWLAAIILTILIQREFWDRWPSFTALAWCGLLLVWFVVGILRKDKSFLLQSATLAGLAFLWIVAATIPPNGPDGLKQIMLDQRIMAAAPVIVIFYSLFGLLIARGEQLLDETAQDYYVLARDIVSWAAVIMLTALVTVEVNEYSRAVTTVVWIGLALVLFEIGRALDNDSLLVQAILLAVAAFARSLLVNLLEPWGQFWFLSGRAAAVVAVAAGLYYLYFRLIKSRRSLPFSIAEAHAGAALSWLALALLAIVLAREITAREWLAPAWTGLLLAVTGLWVAMRDRQQLYQALILVPVVAIGALAYDFPAAGTGPARLGIGLAVAGLFAARFLFQYIAADGAGPFHQQLPAALAGVARNFFALTAALLLTLYVPFEFHDDRAQYFTIAIAGDGFILLVLGFALKDRPLRFAGLGILGFAIIKVFYDLWMLAVDRVYKVIALIGLGLILIVSGLIYSRFSAQIKKILSD